MNRKPYLAVVGATGVVGTTFLKVLEERDFPFENLYIMASAKSAGNVIEFRGKEYVVEELTEHSFDKDIDIALFSAGGAVSEKFAPIAAEHGVVVVDNSSQWRMDPEVPLVVPEVNPEAIAQNKGIIANPNCSTIQMVVALRALEKVAPIKRVVVSTYQAASGAGAAAMQELFDQTRAYLDGEPFEPHAFSDQIADVVESAQKSVVGIHNYQMVTMGNSAYGDYGDYYYSWPFGGYYEDGAGNASRYSYHVPLINASTADAKAINAEIAERFGERVEAQFANMEQGTYLWSLKTE
jgi:hypothetical protein